MKYASAASKIVWGLINTYPRNPYLNVYNEKRKTCRSIKVQGWNKQDYDKAIAALAAAGINSKIVVTPEGGSFWRYGGNYRLHVYED